MRRSERPRLGVIQYSNPEGGSGFIANPSLPWMSGFDITQESPVYDQETAWLRDSARVMSSTDVGTNAALGLRVVRVMLTITSLRS